MFEEVILNNSKLPIAKLYPKAKKAIVSPLTGIEKVNNKYVELVIRDCAKITKSYLPIMIYGAYENPIESLKSKFSKNDIIDLIGRSAKSLEARQLLKLVIISCQKYFIDQQLNSPDLVIEHETKEKIETDDVYGDYGETPDISDVETVDIPDLTNLSSKEIANFLIKTFEC